MRTILMAAALLVGLTLLAPAPAHAGFGFSIAIPGLSIAGGIPPHGYHGYGHFDGCGHARVYVPSYGPHYRPYGHGYQGLGWYAYGRRGFGRGYARRDYGHGRYR